MSAAATVGAVSRLLAAGCVLVLALAASGCSDLRKAVGIEKTAPDEFRVVTRAPLSMPPDYGLKAPKPGASRPQEANIPDRARQIVLASGKPNKAPVNERKFKGRQPWEVALLGKAGADEADPNIRQLVNRETAVLAEAEFDLVESLMFWREPEPGGKVIDAEKEARRLRENAALGRPATTGETPVIKRKERGLFKEGILNSLF
ncbi:MAG: DUF3035 domain-containing protein [Alphaproteobacteria bacterium]